MMTWQDYEARDRFDELLNTTLDIGPQVVRRGETEVAIMVSYEQWCRMLRKGNLKYSDLKEWLLAPEARTENLAPPRKNWSLRPLPDFDD